MKTRIVLFFIIVFGFLLRAYVSVVAYYTTFDTGTVGLMALHILKGERPLFFYGQNYFGSMEAYLAAFLFWIFGPSEFVLSMSPILFSLGWIGATYLLFKELMGVRAGLVAALCVAVPGWVIVWYSIGSYGGYPAAFFLGTMALWLALRISGRELSRRAYWVHVLSLGAIAGLAIWTHLITAAYLLTGAILLAGYFIRNRFSFKLVLPFIAGGFLFVICVLPILISFNHYTDTRSSELHISGSLILQHVRELFHRPLREHLFYPKTLPFFLKSGMLAVMFLVGGIYVWRVKSANGREERYKLLLPVLFACVFLALYLPHPLASTKASRYTIPLWTIVVPALFAASVTISSIVLRRIAIGLLIIWIGYFAVCDVFVARSKMEEKTTSMANRRQVIKSVTKAGIKSVVLVGGSIFGYEGQFLSFDSLDKIRFVSDYHERYQPAAQAVESDPDKAFGCLKTDLPFVKTALAELGVSYSVIDESRIVLIHKLRIKPVSRRVVPVGEMRSGVCGSTKGIAWEVADRITETFLSGSYDGKSGFILDLGKERKINSMALFAPGYLESGLPRGYSISVSSDGTNYNVIRDIEHRVSPSYVNGNQVYFKGYFGIMESRFDPVLARYIRIIFRMGQRHVKEWRVSEAFVFEESGGVASLVPTGEVDNIVSVLRKNDINFTVADRWLSAQLLKLLDGKNKEIPVYPCFDPVFKKTHISRVIVPGKGKAIAVTTEYAEECEKVIRDVYGTSVAWDRIDSGHYSLLIFKGTGKACLEHVKLYWNGHTLLKTTSPETHFGAESEQGINKGGT